MSLLSIPLPIGSVQFLSYYYEPIFVCTSTGLMSLTTRLICEEAQMAMSKPTLFWKLVPADTDKSAFPDNDVLQLPLDKDIFECEQGSIYTFVK